MGGYGQADEGEEYSVVCTWKARIRLRILIFLGITIQYEMCYTNILQILELSQIPIYAKDRTNDDPIVIGGGPMQL